MTEQEINNTKYWVCCPLCDNKKCVKGTDQCEAEQWAKQKREANNGRTKEIDEPYDNTEDEEDYDDEEWED